MSLAGATERRRVAPASLLLLATLALFWGLAWPVMKIVLDEMDVLAFRELSCGAGAVALVLARLSGEKIRLPLRTLPSLTLVALLNVTLWQICMAYALTLMPAGRASIIAYTMPAFATLFGWLFLHERITAPRLAGLALSMAGIGVLVAPEFDRFLAQPLGVLLMIAAAASWGGGTVGMKYFRWPFSIMQNTGWQFVLGGIPIVVAAVAMGSNPHLGALSATAWVSLAYVLTFPILFCQWAWFKVVELLPGSISAMGALAIPVVGTLSAAALLRERLDLSVLVALCLVVAGLALVALRPSRA
ncbi:MAG TPA: DMT family transporter [Stellaceae bacterium]|nr:DMT family transporter [Stellaceae bacterium]